MSKAGKLIKDMLKAKKESVMGKLGDSPYEDPMEPWSAKYAQPVKEETEQLDESDPLLFKYIRSLGYNPEQMDFASRSKYARSNAFKNYKISHMNDQLRTEEVEELDEAGTGLLMSFIKAKGLNPLSMDGNQKKSYSRSSEFRIFKMRHMKEASGMGERGDDWNEQEDKGIRQWDKPNFGLSIQARQAKADNAKKEKPKKEQPKKQSVSEAKDEGEYDYEGAMAKTLLQTICRNAEDIKNMLEDDENLPEWVQSKITKAEDYITTSLDYLKSTKELDEEVLDELSKGTLHSYMSAGHKKFATASPAKQAKLDKGIKKAYKKMYPPVKSEPEKKVDMSSPGAYYKSAGSGRYVGDSVEVEGEPLQELKNSTLKSYVDKVSTGPSRGVTPKGILKSIKAIGGVTKAIRKQAEKPLSELKNQDDNQEIDSHITREDLRKWFSKTDPEGDWKRINSKGEVAGPCAREPGEPKPKCMSKEKRAELSKSERAAAVATKRRHDPVADRAGKGGKPINVSNYGKGKLSEDSVDEAEQMDEKNSPTNPALWSRAKSMARSKFDVYPSAYANGWASKWYKSKGGGWKSVSEDVVQEGIGGIEDSPLSATNSVKAMESEHRKKNMKSARIIKSIYKKKGKNESMYDWEKTDKGGKTPTAKVVLQGGTTMTGQPRDTVEIEPVLKTRPNSQKQ